MKSFGLSFLLFILFLSNVFFSLEASADICRKKEIMFETQFSADNPFVPLMVKVGQSREIYQDFRWGIKILKVFADGKIVKPEVSNLVFDDVNSKSVVVTGDVFVYKTRFNDFLIGNLEESGEYSLTEYSIPYSVAVLDVFYQFIYRDGTKDSTIYHVKAYREN